MTPLSNPHIRAHFLRMAREAGLKTDGGNNNQIVRLCIAVAISANPSIADVIGEVEGHLCVEGAEI
jgi:hypothetical protein